MCRSQSPQVHKTSIFAVFCGGFLPKTHSSTAALSTSYIHVYWTYLYALYTGWIERYVPTTLKPMHTWPCFPSRPNLQDFSKMFVQWLTTTLIRGASLRSQSRTVWSCTWGEWYPKEIIENNRTMWTLNPSQTVTSQLSQDYLRLLPCLLAFGQRPKWI